MITSKFRSLIQSKNSIKKLLYSCSPNIPPPSSCIPPKEKKPCDCPPPDQHKECRDNFTKAKSCFTSPSKKSKHDTERKVWKIITLFVALPLVISYTITTLVMEESDHRRPPYVEYGYMYRREKPFPWGDGKKTFFHNPCLNAVPGIGYEDHKCKSMHHTSDGKHGEEESEGNSEEDGGEDEG